MKFLGVSTLLLLSFFHPVYADNNSTVVKQFVSAFNDKDIDAMLALVDPNMKWMSISGDKVATETNSQDALKTAMQGYFKSMPSARSEIRHSHASGSFVYSLEEAFWAAKGETKSQCSMAVYEFSESKIKHVWYFPSHGC